MCDQPSILHREQGSSNPIMKHSEFVIGSVFYCGGRQWRCPDVGSRVVVAIWLDLTTIVSYSAEAKEPEQHRSLTRFEAVTEGWFKRPPYAVAEHVFDEYDLPACTVDAEL